MKNWTIGNRIVAAIGLFCFLLVLVGGVAWQSLGTIRGQAVTLVTGQGVNSDGQAYRTVTGTFQGKGGPALLSVESPASSWNQDAVDRFIASIH